MDSAEYSQKTDFSKAEIVCIQTKRFAEIRGQEMKPGYWNYDKMGNKVWIPDTRREADGVIKALLGTLKPERMRNPDIEKKIQDKLERKKGLVEIYGVKPRDIINNQIVELPNSHKSIPEIGQSFATKVPQKQRGGATYKKPLFVPGLYDYNVHSYWNEIVELNDELFAILQLLIDQNNYFKQGANF